MVNIGDTHLMELPSEGVGDSTEDFRSPRKAISGRCMCCRATLEKYDMLRFLPWGCQCPWPRQRLQQTCRTGSVIDARPAEVGYEPPFASVMTVTPMRFTWMWAEHPAFLQYIRTRASQLATFARTMASTSPPLVGGCPEPWPRTASSLYVSILLIFGVTSQYVYLGAEWGPPPPNTYVLNANCEGPSLSTPPKRNHSHMTPNLVWVQRTPA